MRTVIQILTVCGLTAGLVYSQAKTESVQSIMENLSGPGAKAPAAEPAARPAPEVKAPAAAPAPAAVKAAPAAVAAVQKPAEIPVDVPAVLEKSREQYVAGNYTEAEAGFKTVLAAEPENKLAAFFLRQLPGKASRTAEETAMKEVDLEWGMILRYYPVTDRLKKSLKLEEADKAADVTKQLSAVEFPEGASALYLPELQKLFVKNTPANLAELEEVLAAFGRAETAASAEQVKIETRFVEFNEGALAELGFNWSDAADGNAVKAGGKWSVADGENLFNGALRTMPFDQTGTAGLGEVRSRTGGQIDNWNVNRIEDMFNSTAAGAGTVGLSGNIAGNQIDLLIRALDQTAGVDVLSAPSVVTLSGQPAVITVGERHFYPGVYEAGTSQGTMLHVRYEEFIEKILGVEMAVTPAIKGDEIQMKINPKITELLGWQQFELSPADTSYTYYQNRVGMQYEHAPITARLPLFNRRELKTEVSVASGATIGMGGLIGEKTEAFKDRVPVLGSIPLVGRLFRSEGERSVKRNLMIFVTASKVTPGGRILSERSFEK